MGAYVAGKAVAINTGDVVVLSSAALSGLKTQAVAVSPNPDGTSAYLTVNNESAVALNVEYSTVDADARYQLLYYLDSGTAGNVLSIAANTAMGFPAGTGFYRILAASDPGATTISIAR